MKNQNRESLKTRKMLLAKKANGVKSVIWRLDSSYRRETIERMGLVAEPFLYEIKTKQISRVANKPSIVKDVHYASKRGKKTLVKRLTNEQMETLISYGFYVRAIKYKIWL